MMKTTTMNANGGYQSVCFGDFHCHCLEILESHHRAPRNRSFSRSHSFYQSRFAFVSPRCALFPYCFCCRGFYGEIGSAVDSLISSSGCGASGNCGNHLDFAHVYLDGLLDFSSGNHCNRILRGAAGLFYPEDLSNLWEDEVPRDNHRAKAAPLDTAAVVDLDLLDDDGGGDLLLCFRTAWDLRFVGPLDSFVAAHVFVFGRGHYSAVGSGVGCWKTGRMIPCKDHRFRKTWNHSATALNYRSPQ